MENINEMGKTHAKVTKWDLTPIAGNWEGKKGQKCINFRHPEMG
jgi:hypothetical protein